MTVSDLYTKQLGLLVKCLPAVTRVSSLALKGGTAINLFYHNMPRVSVDIDLAFLPIVDRETALDAIRSNMVTIGEGIRRTIPQAKVEP